GKSRVSAPLGGCREFFPTDVNCVPKPWHPGASEAPPATCPDPCATPVRPRAEPTPRCHTEPGLVDSSPVDHVSRDDADITSLAPRAVSGNHSGHAVRRGRDRP